VTRVDEVSLVDVRCSTVLVRGDELLLVHRHATDDWVLPGGRPRPGESLASCASREVFEETGLDVRPAHCALVLEVIDPNTRARVVELIFLGDGGDNTRSPGNGEPGATPQWVPIGRLRKLVLRPPIAGYLPAIAHGDRHGAPYVGNLWRSDESWASELWDQAE
jgi:8-oxo-dGTP diphosphatase